MEAHWPIKANTRSRAFACRQHVTATCDITCLLCMCDTRSSSIPWQDQNIALGAMQHAALLCNRPQQLTSSSSSLTQLFEVQG